MQWYIDSADFDTTINQTMTKATDSTEVVVDTSGDWKIDQEVTGVKANVMTGAGTRDLTTAAEITSAKKGTGKLWAKQGLTYKSSTLALKHAQKQTYMQWAAETHTEEDGGASLVSALGAIALGVATLAF